MMYGHILVEPVVVDDVSIKVGKKEVRLAKPQSYDDKPMFGKVIMVAKDRLLDNGEIVPMVVKKGDKIIFQQYSANKVRIEGKDYLIIHEEDIYIIL
jgi:chaperonin GroES